MKIKKENFTEGFKIITLGLLLGLGIGMIQASSWGSPSTTVGTYPPQNEYSPINVGIDSQIKPAFDATKKGALSVNSLSVSAGAEFVKSVSVGAPGLTVLGNKKIADSLTITSLANSTDKKVCTDSAGKLKFCPVIPVASCKGTYTTVGASQASCTGTVADFVSSYGCSTAGKNCATLGITSSANCGSLSACSSSCQWTITQPIVTVQCSTIATQSLCEQKASCTWGI